MMISVELAVRVCGAYGVMDNVKTSEQKADAGAPLCCKARRQLSALHPARSCSATPRPTTFCNRPNARAAKIHAIIASQEKSRVTE